ncbi:MAG: hypothetical protein VB959_15660 [Rhodospirillales bacterium]
MTEKQPIAGTAARLLCLESVGQPLGVRQRYGQFRGAKSETCRRAGDLGFGAGLILLMDEDPAFARISAFVG